MLLFGSALRSWNAGAESGIVGDPLFDDRTWRVVNVAVWIRSLLRTLRALMAGPSFVPPLRPRFRWTDDRQKEIWVYSVKPRQRESPGGEYEATDGLRDRGLWEATVGLLWSVPTDPRRAAGRAHPWPLKRGLRPGSRTGPCGRSMPDRDRAG